MRTISLLLIALLCSPALSAERFVAFPTLGVCTGNSVRCRSQPNTKSEVWSRLDRDDRIVVESRKVVKGEVWYEVSPTDIQESAYVYGKYLEPYYDEEIQKSPVGKLIINILQTYSPDEENDYYSEYDNPEVKRRYSNGWLVRVEAWESECNFGDIKIGDNVSKLTEILGEPDDESDSEWIYTAGDAATFTFKVKDGRINRMIYEGQ